MKRKKAHTRKADPPVSLYPLSPDEALKALLSTPPIKPKTKKKRKRT